MTVELHNKATQVGLLISYYIVLSFWAAQTLSMSLLSRNVAGQTKKTTVVAMNFIAWCVGMQTTRPTSTQSYALLHSFYDPSASLTCVGNAIGPQVFLSRDAPRYFIAFSTHMGCYVLLVIVIAFLRFNFMARNSKKDKVQAQVVEAVDQNLVHAFDDLTDRENPNFRYMY